MAASGRRSARSRAEPPPDLDADYYRRQYIDDANLDLDFFRYTDAHRELIRECLRFKGEHNLRRMNLTPEAAVVAEPVAG